MRARIPLLSAGCKRRSSRSAPPGFPRNKSPVGSEESTRVPVLLVQDMSLCYRLLRQLVPGLAPGRAASRVEILQHVINYILDLQSVLDRDPGNPQRCDRPRQRRQRPQNGQSPGVDAESSDVPRKAVEDQKSWTLLP